MGHDLDISLRGGVISVVYPPANARMGVTGGEPPSIFGPWFQRFSDSIASGWGRRIGAKTNLHHRAFRLVAGCNRQSPRLWRRDLRTRLSIRQHSSQPTRLLHRNATLPQGTELGDRLRSLAHVTSRLSPVGYQDHHPQFPGTQVKEARKIADLENQRDSLRSQLKDTEANLLATQKNADFLESQRDELRSRLNEIEEKAQIAQKNADVMASELNKLRDQLKETENRALTAEKNEELVRTQLDALQTRLQETEREAQTARKECGPCHASA